MKLVTIVGARPQFVKAAAISRVLKDQNDIVEVLVHTGQHYDPSMSEIFFTELEIAAPTHHLEVGPGSHGDQTARMLQAIERVLLKEKPDCVLVYGDTNSTLAGALAAVKLLVPVAHVEAGLRSFNRRMPEEINRVLTDHIAELLFAPTAGAVANLRREGIAENKVLLVGDIMYDAHIYYREKAKRFSTILQRLDLAERGFVLATIHRAENVTDPDRLGACINGLAQVSTRIPVVLPVHPRTATAIHERGLLSNDARDLRLIPPVGYLDMVELERAAQLVVTDSGGIQKEAFFVRRPCVTLRTETEWTELVELGWNRLAPPIDASVIAAIVLDSLDSEGRDASPYGDGRSAEAIVDALVRRVGAFRSAL